MKPIAVLATIAVFIFWVLLISCSVFADYDYQKNFYSYWSLADKASTLEKKSDYINQFAAALDQAELKGTYDAVWLKTSDNSFDRNFDALRSLQSRMEEIRGMDVKSFEYQQAISQITAQEQGEAKEMLEVFEGCWWLKNHFLLWGWVGAIILIFGLALTIMDGIFLYVAFSG